MKSSLDKILLFLGALIATPVAFVILTLIGVALSLAVASVIALAILFAPFLAETEIAKAAGVRTDGGGRRGRGTMTPAKIINPFDALALIAESQVGTQEDARHLNAGAEIRKYQAATTLEGQGWPWCAAFVCWCVQEFVKQNPLVTRASVPRTPSAFGLITWARQQECCLVWSPGADRYQPARGDIVVYKKSHCGIVIAASRDVFSAVEGNTNDGGAREGYEVARRARVYGEVKAFIHLLPAASVTLDPLKGRA